MEYGICNGINIKCVEANREVIEIANRQMVYFTLEKMIIKNRFHKGEI